MELLLQVQRSWTPNLRKALLTQVNPNMTYCMRIQRILTLGEALSLLDKTLLSFPYNLSKYFGESLPLSKEATLLPHGLPHTLRKNVSIGVIKSTMNKVDHRITDLYNDSMSVPPLPENA